MSSSPARENAHDNNRALTFEEMIGAPLAAMVRAQSHSAKATYDFLMQMTEPDRQDPAVRNLKKVRMTYDQLRQARGGRSVESQTLNIPLITLVPVPYLSINEAEIHFNASIVHHEEESAEEKDDKSGESEPHRHLFAKKVQLHAAYASAGKESEDDVSDIDVTIKIKQTMPVGLEKYLGIVGNSITVE